MPLEFPPGNDPDDPGDDLGELLQQLDAADSERQARRADTEEELDVLLGRPSPLFEKLFTSAPGAEAAESSGHEHVPPSPSEWFTDTSREFAGYSEPKNKDLSVFADNPADVEMVRVPGLKERFDTARTEYMTAYRAHLMSMRNVEMRQAVGLAGLHRRGIKSLKHERDAYEKARNALLGYVKKSALAAERQASLMEDLLLHEERSFMQIRKEGLARERRSALDALAHSYGQMARLIPEKARPFVHALVVGAAVSGIAAVSGTAALAAAGVGAAYAAKRTLMGMAVGFTVATATDFGFHIADRRRKARTSKRLDESALTGDAARLGKVIEAQAKEIFEVENQGERRMLIRQLTTMLAGVAGLGAAGGSLLIDAFDGAESVNAIHIPESPEPMMPEAIPTPEPSIGTIPEPPQDFPYSPETAPDAAPPPVAEVSTEPDTVEAPPVPELVAEPVVETVAVPAGEGAIRTFENFLESSPEAGERLGEMLRGIGVDTTLSPAEQADQLARQLDFLNMFGESPVIPEGTTFEMSGDGITMHLPDGSAEDLVSRAEDGSWTVKPYTP